MSTDRSAPGDVDAYIAGFPPKVRSILKKLRSTIRKAAPGAEERLSYRLPAYFLEGNLAYFGAFKEHIGFYPPVTGDAALAKEASVHAGEKGNLRFPLDQPIPYDLVARIVKLRVQQNRGKKALAKRGKRQAG